MIHYNVVPFSFLPNFRMDLEMTNELNNENDLVSIMLDCQPVYEVLISKLTPASAINFLEAIKVNKEGQSLMRKIDNSSKSHDWYYYYSCTRGSCIHSPILGKERPTLNDNYIPIQCLKNYERLQQYNPPSDQMNHEELEIIFDYLIRMSQVQG